jgi:hypothetical protein
VYFIPHLRVSIISIRELDETDCRVDIHGSVLRIFDQSNQLLAKVSYVVSRLYH